MGLSEKDCVWHSPLMTFVQLKALKNMGIRSQQSEDRRRERWGDLNEKYKEKRDDSRVERRERKIVFRLCGEIPSRMLVDKDLARSAESEAESLLHALHSRLRRLCGHQ
jgi:diadenosine tetraphosphatase ApaH/serine/threonine PP2A family protein phosphatase